MSGIDYEKFAFSFNHAIITLNEKQFSAISAVQFSQAIDRSAIYGTSRKPLKRSAGQLQMGEGTVTFSDLDEAMSFYAALGTDPSASLFSLNIQLANEAGQTRAYECLSSALSGFNANFEQGADALSLEMPFTFMLLKVDGKEFAR